MNSAHNNCKLVVFSDKAWNAIVSETFRKDPVETGGILMGHILSEGDWIVMEVIPPGLNAIHQKAYFEPDEDFVNYLVDSVSRQYKRELKILGLWHRHPGNMDVFSGTDDNTNARYAQGNSNGAISGLVNVDPKFRFTLRHVAYPLDYQIVDVEVGDDLIPPQYFELKYAFGSDLRPSLPGNTISENKTIIGEPERQQNTGNSYQNGNLNNPQGGNPINAHGNKPDVGQDNTESANSIAGIKDTPRNNENNNIFQKYLPVLVAIGCLLIGVMIGGAKCSRHDDKKETATPEGNVPQTKPVENSMQPVELEKRLEINTEPTADPTKEETKPDENLTKPVEPEKRLEINTEPTADPTKEETKPDENPTQSSNENV